FFVVEIQTQGLSSYQVNTRRKDRRTYGDLDQELCARERRVRDKSCSGTPSTQAGKLSFGGRIRRGACGL
ncbi:MAG TPA: hypothetical protein PKE01_16995, partial [Rhodocyclaceae bacterium]|nr:hypothetical protein [Rhodocyclaceae bacterium]